MYSQDIFIKNCIIWLKTIYNEDDDYDIISPLISYYIKYYCDHYYNNDDYKIITNLYIPNYFDNYNKEKTIDILEYFIASKIFDEFIDIEYSSCDTIISN